MPIEDAVCSAEPNYKAEYKRLSDENRWLKEEVEDLRMTIIEMCKYIFASRFKD